jgi:hypothetical protein
LLVVKVIGSSVVFFDLGVNGIKNGLLFGIACSLGDGPKTGIAVKIAWFLNARGG